MNRIRAGGGAISLDHVTFEDNDLCYKLDDHVTGRAADCRVDGALFGRWHKPAGFRCKRTTYADDDLTDHEDDSDDSDAGEVGGSAAVG